MKEFYQHILEHIVGHFVYSLLVVIMLAIIAILIRYNKEYLWFAPVIIAVLLIILLSIVKVVFMYNKKKIVKIETIKKQKEEQRNQQLEIKDIDLMPLTKAVDKLIDAGKQKQIIKRIDYDIEMQNDADRYYGPFVRLIARHADIYGKRPSLSFIKWEIISEDMILMGYFRKLGSELYFNKDLMFVDLAIRQDEFYKAILEIMSLDRPFSWLSYEVK